MQNDHRRGGAVAGILLTILFLAVLGFVTLFSTGVYVASHARVSENTGSGTASIETPFGSIHVHESDRVDPDHLGVPLYPGATRVHKAHKLASFHLDFGDTHKSFAIGAAEYRTSDSLDRVAEFYRGELPHWMISQKDNGGLELSFTKHGYRRFVAIYEDDWETHIALASMGEPASN